ncbi:hypothetical protein O4214_27520 [Rhodococcus erythropolis]|uniref:hypothetical protein n=1 Tax=Rhodococcus erythropolis TaxID=1833 RepID=UPI001E31C8FE|nr:MULTISPECIES: hypothetical protein [Rhodococcus erythropolis group]MCD2108712.1 hypothetical protein [Rhodococcus qingshengii]MCZ4527739.1 hypothetical protein [Rhodococcus erythropolis]
MTDFEFVEVESELNSVNEIEEKFVDEQIEAKDVAAEEKSEAQQLEEAKKYFKNLFANMGAK